MIRINDTSTGKQRKQSISTRRRVYQHRKWCSEKCRSLVKNSLTRVYRKTYYKKRNGDLAQELIAVFDPKICIINDRFCEGDIQLGHKKSVRDTKV